MSANISRRKLARFVADEIRRGVKLDDSLEQLAAYLIESRRLREIDGVVRAIEDELAARGTIIAHVSSARPLDATIRDEIKSRIGGKDIRISETVDPSLLGGVRIETPGNILDATLKSKLLTLRQAKV